MMSHKAGQTNFLISRILLMFKKMRAKENFKKCSGCYRRIRGLLRGRQRTHAGVSDTIVGGQIMDLERFGPANEEKLSPH